MGRFLRHCIVVPLLGASATVAGAQDWMPIGPPGGAMNSVAVDPDDPDTVYAVGSFQLFRSGNGGRDWQPQPVREAQNIAVASGGVVYVDGLPSPSKSSDGGRTWQPLAALAGEYVYAFAVNPTQPQVVYALLTAGVVKSVDGGTTWSPCCAGLPQPQYRAVLAVDPSAPGTLYALIPSAGLFTSTDGAAWQQGGAGLPLDCGIPYRVGSPDAPIQHVCLLSMTVDPTVSGTLYVGTDGMGVYRSTDGGDSWEALGGELGERAVTAVAVDASNPQRLYAGMGAAHDPVTGAVIDQSGGPVYRSDDGGALWNEASGGLPVSLVAGLALDPNDADTVHVATAGAGLFASRDGGATWQPAEDGPNASCLRAIAAAGTTPTTVLTVDDDSSALAHLFSSADGGDTWADTGLASPLVGIWSFAVDASDPSTVYAAPYDSSVLKTTDTGRSWVRRDTGFGTLVGLALDPGAQTTLYGCGPAGVIKSTDGAATWAAANAGLPSIDQVAVDEGTGTVYATAPGVAFRSSDGGETWTGITPVPRSLSGTLTVAPTTPATLFASTYEGLYVSRDGGDSWGVTMLPGATGSVRLVVSPANPTTVYAMTDGQLQRSDDGGDGWRPVGARLDLPVNAITVDANRPEVIYAATCLHGAFALTQTTQTGHGSGSGCAVGPPARWSATTLLVNLLVVALLALRRTKRRRVMDGVGVRGGQRSQAEKRRRNAPPAPS